MGIRSEIWTADCDWIMAYTNKCWRRRAAVHGTLARLFFAAFGRSEHEKRLNGSYHIP